MIYQNRLQADCLWSATPGRDRQGGSEDVMGRRSFGQDRSGEAERCAGWGGVREAAGFG